MIHSCILSVCSATGQLFIYYTISQFGPVTFIIIMTIRMGRSRLTFLATAADWLYTRKAQSVQNTFSEIFLLGKFEA